MTDGALRPLAIAVVVQVLLGSAVIVWALLGFPLPAAITGAGERPAARLLQAVAAVALGQPQQRLHFAQIGDHHVGELKAVPLQQLPEGLLVIVKPLDALAHFRLLQNLIDRHGLQPLDQLEEVAIELAEAGAAVDGVPEQDVSGRVLDVLRRQLCRIEAIGVVDQGGQPQKSGIIRLFLQIVFVD